MTAMLRRTRGPVTVAAVAATFAFSGSAVAAAPKPSLTFSSCGSAGAQCAVATLPRDYDNPNGPKLGVTVARSPATDPAHRIGSLFINFGGPGDTPSDRVQALGAKLFPTLNKRFDIVAVDPRGTSGSFPVDCRANQETQGVYSQPFTTPNTLNTDALVAKDQAYINRCLALNGRDRLRLLSTANVARDINSVRAALGESKLSYLGFSYGTFLGATLQSLFPGKTRAVVLDGALDPAQYVDDPLGSLDEQTAGFERAISRFMIACAADQAGCKFGGSDPLGTVDRLIAQADATPIPASNAPDRPVDGDDIRATLVQAVYSKRLWPTLAAALAQLAAGDGAGVRTVTDGFYGRLPDGTYDPLSDRYFLIGAGEQNYPRQVQPFLDAGRASFQDYEHAYFNHGYSELNWGLYPVRDKDTFGGPFRTTAKDPTTLVVGTRYDPATPYQEAQRLVGQLGNARLLTEDGDGHTAYDGNPANGTNSRCIDAAVEGYLTDLAVPAAGTTCPQDQPAFPAAATASAARAAKAKSRRLPVIVRAGTRPRDR